MRISENTLNTIREQIDIVDVVSNYLVLKRTGVNFRALCPFHSEKTPSFFVSPQKQIFHCFGCGKGGDVIKFVSEIEGINYFEAALKLAKEYGIQVEYEGGSDYLKIIELNKLTADFFHKNLLKNLKNKIIKDFIEKRGLNEDIIEKFYLGYSGEEGELLEFYNNKGIPIDLVKKAGLVKEKGGNYYETFKNRIIFPIRNIHGEFIAFGGRVLNDNNMPKYLNSPETPVYNKSRSLYGIFESKENIKKLNEVIIVEGYMDLISLYKNGIKNCVASLGTSLTLTQIDILKRFTENIYFLYDGDNAGIKASVRGSIICINKNIIPKIISLPDKLDPDDFFKLKEIEDFLDLKNKAKDLTEFIFDKIKHLDLNQINTKLKVLKKIQNIYIEIENPVYRNYFLKKIAEFLEITENEIKDYFKKYVKVRRLTNEDKNEKRIELNAEDKITAFIIQNLDEVEINNEILEYITDDFNKKLLNKVKSTKNVLSIETDEEFSEEEKKRVRIYLTYDLGIRKDIKEKFIKEAFERLKLNFYRSLIKKYKETLKEFEKKGEYQNEEYYKILNRIEKLQKEAMG